MSYILFLSRLCTTILNTIIRENDFDFSTAIDLDPESRSLKI